MYRMLLGVALMAGPALAATPDTVKVSYADLDLHSRAGVARLDRRLEAAINRVCGKSDGSALGYSLTSKCFAAAHKSVAVQRDAVLAMVERSDRTAALDIAR